MYISWDGVMRGSGLVTGDWHIGTLGDATWKMYMTCQESRETQYTRRSQNPTSYHIKSTHTKSPHLSITMWKTLSLEGRSTALQVFFRHAHSQAR